ncbi:MAG TPA: bifunctional phosphoribosylaminoimidazolecarboxamide formyltransferase/IMP cyclohydrolase [Vicinamibacterales bacterium]|nr:bifunctional phosphoribosylaminoimidazolecarboxamide formyltransferase/IMP cyclohydrolase [Vicinamibacterales bacterium]
MRAILSVSDKTGLVELARGLADLGIHLISTGGTAKAIAAAGLPVMNVSDVTGFPEMMDGRVKTLHPAVHGGILARRHRPDDLAAIGAQGIELIDIVVVNLYPFGKAADNPETTFDALVEEIDIGGPSLLRAAGKNFRDVLVVVSPDDYPKVLQALAREGGPSLDFRFSLMKKAFMHTGQYDGMIAMTMMHVDVEGEALTRRAVKGPTAPRQQEPRHLRYGENPHQQASWMPVPDEFKREWRVHQGKELSYTNLLDLDAAMRIALEFTEPAGVVVKHTNPCGVATGTSAEEAYVRAREADPLSAFGGIVGLNRSIDVDTARALTATFIEAVIAPGLDDEAKAVLAMKQNLRVITTDFAKAYEPIMNQEPREMRSFLGGVLVQQPDRVTEALEPWPPGASASQAHSIRVVTKRQPTPEEWTALRFAWRVCAHVKSNTIVFTGTDRTLAVGAGQMSRVDAVNVAVMKAPNKLKGSVAASDAFFPFRDGLDALVNAGATAVVQPGGSVKDGEVIAAADEHGIAMVFTGRRHFRH